MNWLASPLRSARTRRYVLLVGAALSLHILVLGPVLMLRLERTFAEKEMRISFDIVALETSQTLRPSKEAEPVVSDPPLQSSRPVDPDVAKPLAKPEMAEVKVPAVTAPPRAPQAVISLPSPTHVPASPPGSPRPAGRQIGSAEQFALRAIFCRDMTDWQRQDAGCDRVEAARQQFAPLYDATPLSDYQRIQETYAAQLASARGQGGVESFMARNNGVPDRMPGGIDNRIFIEPRPSTQGALERIRRDQKPDWEDAVRRAHGTD